MKLDAKTILFIKNAVKTAQLVNIENLIIEPNAIRGVDEDRTVVLFHEKDIPSVPFGSLGIARLGVFLSRLDIVQSQELFDVDASGDEKEGWIKNLTMKSAGTKIDYRCTKPDSIQAPKRIHDVMRARVQLTNDAVSILQKGQAAMSADEVSIISNTGGVSFELIDVTSDVFKHVFADAALPLTPDAVTSFAYRYPLKTILALFKKEPDGHFDIGQKGILRVNINGLDVYVLPRA